LHAVPGEESHEAQRGALEIRRLPDDGEALVQAVEREVLLRDARDERPDAAMMRSVRASSTTHRDVTLARVHRADLPLESSDYTSD
jgi:hypothetical protein